MMEQGQNLQMMEPATWPEQAKLAAAGKTEELQALQEKLKGGRLVPDKLTSLEGIGPKVESLLNENGITTYIQLAETSVDKLNEILDANDLQMMDPTYWPEQAKLAGLGKSEELQTLQDKLKGGRMVEEE